MGIIIPEHKYTQREESVCSILKNRNNIKSFLNVGFHNWEDPRRHWWIKICEQNNIKWDILEIFKPNVIDAIEKGCPSERIINSSILNFDSYGDYDCIMFWHGPEHIEKDIFMSNLPKIEEKAKELLILGMPLGEEEQPEVYGNKWEEHVSFFTPEDFDSIGYKSIEVHDRIPAHFTTYKEM